MLRRVRRLDRSAGRALCVALLSSGALGACGGGEGASVGDDRSDQIRAAAAEAGLPAEVADVLALAARGIDATFTITYEGEPGTSIVVAQAPPQRRIDIVIGGVIVESRILRNGIGYACTIERTTPPTLPAGTPGITLPSDAPPPEAGPLTCTRRTGAAEGEGVFSEAALRTFSDELAASLDTVELTVEERTIAEAAATCLISAPRAGTPLTGTEPGVETICLSDEGAQLLVDAAGERVVATGYSDAVADGIFDLPD